MRLARLRKMSWKKLDLKDNRNCGWPRKKSKDRIPKEGVTTAQEKEGRQGGFLGFGRPDGKGEGRLRSVDTPGKLSIWLLEYLFVEHFLVGE